MHISRYSPWEKVLEGELLNKRENGLILGLHNAQFSFLKYKLMLPATISESIFPVLINKVCITELFDIYLL